jgi:hypothetical protein
LGVRTIDRKVSKRSLLILVLRGLKLIAHTALDELSRSIGIPGMYQQFRFYQAGKSSLRLAIQFAGDAFSAQFVADNLGLVDVIRDVDHYDFIGIVMHGKARKSYAASTEARFRHQGPQRGLGRKGTGSM